ncbi:MULTISPECIES: 4-hydroxybenzoate octaprenyltransferase [unclassified Chelatococcus]|uniref:4-hydroxybenzoate octaprenyltransferase n=1 Tax=unclassified Chelatococcus TaxID=2638111 RepID=UPI001BCFBDE2|nr:MULTISPECIES: 4-hydroxybenzoate octaprenyltransferase [unclassified Chelatococcus]MBS7695796.1 4-hydroxybenzoate octaprenyltransferase [Chelatococcus sp. YT9]MBX3555829.1 4-hydroxybenzoate octaprenyltransferase [Chelatococcus sp.]
MIDSIDRPLPDAPLGNWVDRYAPQAWRPYLRLARMDRPIGLWLLLLPCWWSAALAAGALGRSGPDPWHLVLFMIGATAMRGAGSTYNDIVDRDLDAMVARTRHRPLPSGQVTPRQALVLLVALCLIGLGVLLQFNRFAIMVGLASLIIVAIYPFMKRVTSMPQLVLGLAFAWGGLMGWAALAGRLDPPAFLIYGAAIAWTVGYDTIYALQDIEDDPIAGIKSSARLFGAHARLGVGFCYALAVLLALAAVVLAHGGALAYCGLAAFAGHLAWQLSRIRLGDEAGALRLFKSNRDAGLLLFAGLTLDAILRNV